MRDHVEHLPKRLGIIFEALTGQIPFKGKTYTERIVSILQDSPQFETALPRAGSLHIALSKCLAKDPAGRFSSSSALQAELVPLIANFNVADEQARRLRERAFKKGQ